MIGGGDMVTAKQQRLTDPVMRQAAQLPAVEFLGCHEPTHAGLDGWLVLALGPLVTALIERRERQSLTIADAFRQCPRSFQVWQNEVHFIQDKMCVAQFEAKI